MGSWEFGARASDVAEFGEKLLLFASRGKYSFYGVVVHMQLDVLVWIRIFCSQPRQ